MADSAGQSTTGGAESSRDLVGTLKKVGLSLLAIVLIGIFLAALLPRWWAQQIGQLIDGRITYGSLFGVLVGFVCSIVPLLLLFFAVRARRRGWLLWVLLIGTLATAFPNLMTLWIVWGTGNSAHAGERVLDVDGPGFRGGSLVGAVLGALLFLVAAWALWRRDSGDKPKT